MSYETSFRRHLCDMHIEDWNDVFLSEFSPQTYFELLKKAKIQTAQFYFQSHVGYCYFPTKSGRMHRAFEGKESMMRDLMNLCRNSGMQVMGYYSIIYNTWAHDTHPQWRMVLPDGRSRREANAEVTMECSDAKAARYGLCCPNNPEYRAFVFRQMEEFNSYFDFDVMYFDMPFWSHFCYCEHCKARWEQEVGGSLPESGSWDDPQWHLHAQKRREWMGDFVQTIAAKMKELRAGVPVEFNFASAIVNDCELCCAEEVNAACEYVGGDLYGGILEQSFACKFYRNITQHQPFEYMFSRCTPNLSAHTVTKSPDQMKAAVMLTAAHHGATLVIDAIDPIGTMDRRVYERVGQVFAEEIPYEPYFHGKMIEDVGVYFSLRSKYHADGNDFSNQDCCINAVKSCIGEHIPVGVTGGFHSLDGYRVIIAPFLTEDDAYDNRRLVDYVAQGGTLYLSGARNQALLSELLGIRIDGYTDGYVVYAAPVEDMPLFGWYNADYPLPFYARTPLVHAGADCRVLATVTLPYVSDTDIRYASIHSNPPGIATKYPAIVERSYGAGRVIWSAVPLENNPNYEYRQIFLKLLETGAPSVTCDASANTELIAFDDDGRIRISLSELSEEYFIAENPGCTVRVQCEKTPVAVRRLPDGDSIDFEFDGNCAEFFTGNFHVFGMFEVEF